MQGALIAIPFAIIMMILAQLSNINVSMDLTGTVILLGNIPKTDITISAGAGVIDVMLWSLLSGAVLGALGGIYQFSMIGQNIDSALVSIAHIPLRLLEPFFMLFDQLSGRQQRKAPRGRALTLLYSTLCVTVIVTALSVVAGILLMSFSTLITYDLNSNIHSIINTLVIILPGLLLVGTLIAVIVENPQTGVQTQENTGATLNQPAGGTI